MRRPGRGARAHEPLLTLTRRVLGYKPCRGARRLWPRMSTPRLTRRVIRRVEGPTTHALSAWWHGGALIGLAFIAAAVAAMLFRSAR
jgi:hypothetical protein